MENRIVKLYTKNSTVPLKVVPGHFATNHSHVNYYIDMTTLKTRVSEATDVAQTLAGKYMLNTVIDTIVCLDGTQVIGTLLAQELTRTGLHSMNSHKTIYVITPEINGTSQLIFRDNLQPMVEKKHVLILMASVSTGITVRRSAECISYYGGIMAGVASIFSKVEEIDGYQINAIFHQQDVPDYQSYAAHDCPMCKAGQRIDALVNSFGYSKL
ncbi:orotate phosphoribosyltransferase [uncultured Ruthenibacterium sp.]|uniref:orotate phosphoribosyltransferase n=1 Tax=uncultured Ruthenibacterium sp. TaxID=1905347 RepID=UPI00349EB8C6